MQILLFYDCHCFYENDIFCWTVKVQLSDVMKKLTFKISLVYLLCHNSLQISQILVGGTTYFCPASFGRHLSVFPCLIKRYFAKDTFCKCHIGYFSNALVWIGFIRCVNNLGTGRVGALSSGYGRRLMFQRLWVQTPAPYTGWRFFPINLL